MQQNRTILLTGFGPFPGMPENISGRLAEALAELARQRFPGHRITAHVLPTDWALGPEQLQALYAQEKPSVALHFGVSKRAEGLVIEMVARNEIAPRADAAGCLPAAAKVMEEGPATLEAVLPVEVILSRVANLGIPAFRSENAGAYLCNATLYRALTMAAASEKPVTAGFIHIPHELGEGAPLDWDSALVGALEIVDACISQTFPSVSEAQAVNLRATG